MRILLAAAGLAAVFALTPVAQAACEGQITTIGDEYSFDLVFITVDCEGCTLYLVQGGPNFALYREENGVPGLQRGGAPLVQGGNDNCFQGFDPDARIL